MGREKKPSPSSWIGQPSGREALVNNIWVVGSAAVIASVAANLIIRAIAVPALDISGEFEPMQMPRIAFFTVIGTGRRSGGVSLHQTTGQPTREDVPHRRRCGTCRVLRTQPVSPLRRNARSVSRPNGFGGCGSDVDASSRGGNHSGDTGLVGTTRQRMTCSDAVPRRRTNQAEVCTCQE